MAYPTRRTFNQLYLLVDTLSYGTGTASSPFIATIKNELNEALEKVWGHILNAKVDLLHATSYINLTNGGQEYDLPADFYRIKEVSYNPVGSTAYVPLRHIDQTDERFPFYTGTDTAAYRDTFGYYDIYTIKASGFEYPKPVIRLDHPALTARANGLRIVYVYKPAPMVVDGDYINLNPEWESVIYNLATGLFISKYLGDAERAQSFLQTANDSMFVHLRGVKDTVSSKVYHMRSGR